MDFQTTVERYSFSSGLVKFTFTLVVLASWVHEGVASGRALQGLDSSSNITRMDLQTGLSFQDRLTDGLCKTLVEPAGYPCEEYTVQTGDGFKLAVQHIPHGKDGATGSTKAPVFLQHGVLAGGEAWLLNGPGESLAYILADLGFDVWIGNIRCVGWSHGHTSLNPSDAAYWDWSFDEVAQYDLPAMMQLVYSKTSQQMLYVGHSMGTTILMAALIEQAPQLTDIVKGAALVCPIALMTHVTSPFDQAAAHLYLDQVYNLFHANEFNLHSDALNNLVDVVCKIPNIDCTHLLPNVAGQTCCFDPKRMPDYLKYYPQPTSTKNMAHYAQIVRKDPFRKYDYGFMQNLIHYHQRTPPVYDFSKFPASVKLFMVSGTQDSLSNTVDVATLTQALNPSVQGSVILPQYAHVDFILSQTATVDVWPKVTTWFESLISS